MLLATTSSCRSNATCRESPTRSAFSIGGSPLRVDPPEANALPGAVRADLVKPAKALPSRAVRWTYQRKPCQVGKCLYLKGLGRSPECFAGGRKVLLTMFARQVFPSRATKGKLPLTIATLASPSR